jgi:hypothetical protein
MEWHASASIKEIHHFSQKGFFFGRGPYERKIIEFDENPNPYDDDDVDDDFVAMAVIENPIPECYKGMPVVRLGQRDYANKLKIWTKQQKRAGNWKEALFIY